MITVESLYSIFQQHPFISTDSRTIIPGSVFFALKGQNFDGNSFAMQALQLGAARVVIDNPEYNNDSRCILTDNVLKMLQQLAVYHRRKLKTKIIGITGTNGKTTTKELIFNVLRQKYKTSATTGNLNNHIGVPLTLLKIDPGTEMAIIEMGANHPGEIEELCNIALPDYGIITNIGKAHLEGFGSINGIAETKSALYRYVASAGGTIFVNGDNLLLMSLSANNQIVTYGTSPDLNCHCMLMESQSFLGVEWYNDDVISIKTQLAGDYNFENVMAAICIGDYFGIESGKIKEALEFYIPRNNRSQHMNTQYNHIILDCYNANPSSMEASLLSFSKMKAENQTVILGDMFELGEYGEEEHHRIVELIKTLHFKRVILCGDLFNAVSKENEFISFRDTDSTINWLIENPVRNSNIMIKGSRGMKMERMLDHL